MLRSRRGIDPWRRHGEIVPMDRGGVKFPRFRLSLLPFFSSRPTVKCVYNKDPILKDRENYPGWFALFRKGGSR